MAAVSAATPLGRPTTSTSRAAAASTGSPAWMYASTAREAQLVHHLHRRRDDAGGDHGADRRCAGLDGVEVHQHRADRRRVRRQAHADLRGDAEHPLAADEHATQVVARRLGVLAAEHDHLAVGQDDLEAEDVGVGDALGEAVRTARVVGHVAADRARLLAARVRGEVQPVGGHRTAEVEVEHAWLDPRPPDGGVDRQDAVHLGREMMTAPSGGTAPPASPVPEPRATNGTPWRRRRARTPAPRPWSAGSTRRPPRPPSPTRRGGTARARSAPSRTRSVERALARSSATSAGGHSGGSGRRMRMTRPDSTGSPSTSTSSPGARWSCRRTSRPSRSARSSRSRWRAADRPSRTASATRSPGATDAVHGALRRRWPAPAAAPSPSPCAGRTGAGGTRDHATGEPHDAPHHAPRRRRRTARDVPVASPAALIIGVPTASWARGCSGDGTADGLGRAEHAVERSRSSRAAATVACVVGRSRAARRAAARLGADRRRPRRAETAARRAPARARRRARRTPSAHEHARHHEHELTCRHVRSSSPASCLVRPACARRPPLLAVLARSVPLASTSPSGRYCWSIHRRARRARGHEGSRSPTPWPSDCGALVVAPRRWGGTSPIAPSARRCGPARWRPRSSCSWGPWPGGWRPGPG